MVIPENKQYKFKTDDKDNQNNTKTQGAKC